MNAAWLDANSTPILWCFGGLVTSLLLYLLFYPALVAAAAPVIRSEEIPLLSSSPSVSGNKRKNDDILLSIVIPAYNEELRLDIMLREAYDYLTGTDCPALRSLSRAAPDSSSSDTISAATQIEFILVDDGSQDQTERVYRYFCQKQANAAAASLSDGVRIHFRLLRLRRNAGKGAAVQTGMLAARGAFCLMVDADGATAFGPGLEAVARYAASHDFVLGSRSDALDPITPSSSSSSSSSSAAQRSPLRKLLQSGFHLLVVCLVGTPEIQDTQCGFKLFRGHVVVPLLFARLHLRRWAFDTELLYRAAGVHLRLQEVAVPWHEVEGSKLNTGPLSLARVAGSMLRDMLCVRLCYTLRIWKLPSREMMVGHEREKDR